MTYLLLQTFLLLLASYFLGAFVACLAKRMFFASQDEAPAQAFAPVDIDAPVRPPVMVPPQPVRQRVAPPVLQPVTPRAIDPVQPKIEVLRRPEPRPAPAVLDPSRFERALIGPDANEGVPRIAVVELRPSVLPPVTDEYRPPEPPPAPPVEEVPPELPAAEDFAVEQPEPEVEPISEHEPEPQPEPTPEPRAGGLAARLRDATTAAAAGAVAAAKAAAAASIAMPGMGLSRRSAVEEAVSDAPLLPEKEDDARASERQDISGPVGDEASTPAEEHGEPPIEIADEQEESVVHETEHGFEAVPEIVPEPTPETALEVAPQPELERQSEPEPEREPQTAPGIQSVPEVVAPAPVIEPAALIEDGDDFQRIRAIDGDIEQKLKARGVIYFEHIAGWSASDVKQIGQELEIPGRIDREQWVEQAQILAKGGETYYSRNRRAMLKAKAEAAGATGKRDDVPPSSSRSGSESAAPAPSQIATEVASQRAGLAGVAAASQGRSVAEMAAAAAAAIAASSASVTRGLKPIEPISPLSKVDPKISMPARITDAIREKGSSSTSTVEIETESAPLPEAADDGPKDDLKRIRGIGVLIEKRLNALGIRRYDQIANWTSGDIDRVSRMLEFKGRIERESWVEQARILASGGYTEFSRRVDRGEVDTSRET